MWTADTSNVYFINTKKKIRRYGGEAKVEEFSARNTELRKRRQRGT